MGEKRWKIVREVMIKEDLKGIIEGLKVKVIKIIGDQEMDGEIGEGGIGEIEIRYGYKSFEKKVMIEVVIIIIIMV